MATVLKRHETALNFSLMVAGGWIATPIAAVFLHLRGFGSDPHLVALLLGFSAWAPFQILCNEYLAASKAIDRLSVSTMQTAVICALQFALVLLVLGDDVTLVEKIVLSASLAIGTILSIGSTERYYRSALAGKVERTHAVLYGALPGLTVLAIALLVGIAPYLSPLLLLGGIAAVLAQRAHLNALGAQRGEQDAPRARWAILAVAVVATCALAAASTLLRDAISSYDQRFTALILIALNVVGTAVMVASRVAYVTGRQVGYGLPSVVALGMGGVSGAVYLLWPLLGLLIGLVSVQLAIMALMIGLRR